jgi:hypothetical protein
VRLHNNGPKLAASQALIRDSGISFFVWIERFERPGGGWGLDVRQVMH